MRDIEEIWSELRKHPDFIECVIWTREDLESHISDLADDGIIVTASVYHIMNNLHMDGWESVSIELGWELLYDAVREFGEIIYEEDDNV
jgi:hypothetical protein